jgi:hypothetical protein
LTSLLFLSKIICDIDVDDRTRIIEGILKKFKDKPNSEDMHLWLQRIALVANLNIKDAETELVKLINFEAEQGIKFYPRPADYEYTGIWNSKEWLADSYYDLIKTHNIVSQEEIDKLDCVIHNKEVNSFYSAISTKILTNIE